MQSLTYTNGVYRTAANRISWWGRVFPTVAFYRRFLANVVRSSKEAKRGEYDGARWSRSSLEVLQSLESVGVQFEITGVDHLKQLTTPCLVIGNHMGMMETTVLPAILQPIRDVTFIVKSSLLNFPVFKHVMRSRDPIEVSQTNPRQDLKNVLEGGADRLKRGISVMVFPQGTRTPEFSPADFNTLGILSLGIVAFAIGTASGVLIAKLMNKLPGSPINPLIGSAGVSAVPMAARVSNKVGLEADPHNFLLMHAMGPNVAGVIGSAVAAGVMISLVGG